MKRQISGYPEFKINIFLKGFTQEKIREGNTESVKE